MSFNRKQLNPRIRRSISAALLFLATGCAAVQSPPEASVSPNAAPTTATPAIDPESPAVDPARSTTTAAAQPQAYRKTTVVSGLERPWGMAWLPDGAMLVTERPGRLRLIRNGQLEATPIAGVPEVFASNQGGLLDVAVHPQFNENRWIYLAYAHGTAEANRTRVARAEFDGRSLSNVQVIFDVARDKTDGQHFGSRLLWLPDGTMLVAIGDGGNPPVELEGELIRRQAQNLQSRLGKVVRLTEDGSPAKDNPFVNQSNADPVLWSYGHRNIQGLAFDPINNRIWATEHGARGGDELNLLEPGKNYGWPIVTHSREYSGGVISEEQSRPGMVDPKEVWTPAIAPSGLAVYSGDRFLAWRGHLFAGGLVSQDVRRLQVDNAGTVLAEESIPIGQRVRDVRQGPDGLLYVLTDASDGQLIRIEPE